VGNAESAWGHLVEPLSNRFEVVLHTRSGYPPRPPEERIDFDDQADELAGELRDRDHLVGHSYGGVVSMLAAARTDARLASLTVSEPPAFGLAPDDPAVLAFLEGYQRTPDQAVIPLVALATFPVLVLSGAHHPAFDAVCDVLVERVGATRAVLPGAGHSISRAPGYEETITRFFARALPAPGA
jgi:pimeloyl-ACP methyl ester carboxylesterase